MVFPQPNLFLQDDEADPSSLQRAQYDQSMRQPPLQGGGFMGQVVNPPGAMPNSFFQGSMMQGPSGMQQQQQQPLQQQGNAGMMRPDMMMNSGMYQPQQPQQQQQRGFTPYMGGGNNPSQGGSNTQWDLAAPVVAGGESGGGVNLPPQQQQQPQQPPPPQQHPNMPFNNLDVGLDHNMYNPGPARRPSLIQAQAQPLQNMLGNTMQAHPMNALPSSLQAGWMNQNHMPQGMYNSNDPNEPPGAVWPKNPAFSLATANVGGPEPYYPDMMGLQAPEQQLFFQQQQQFQQQMMSGAKRRRSSLSTTGSFEGGGPRRRTSLTGGGIFPADYRHMGNQPVIPTDGEQFVKRKEKKKRAKTFPEKLMQALMDHGEEDAVAWLPDGKSFVIVSPDMFVSKVLNRVFKQSKYASFVRKLHRWGFVRLTSGTGTDCFHHPLFQKNRKDLASKISCTPRDKDTAVKGRNDKPPSLAGVEKFIRAKAAAAVAAANASNALAIPVETTVPSLNAEERGEGQDQDAGAPLAAFQQVAPI